MFLLFLIVVLNDLVKIIPMAALVAVMIMVSIGTFSWRSVLDLRRNPLPSSVVMIATVVTVITTHDLAKGVIVGCCYQVYSLLEKFAFYCYQTKRRDNQDAHLHR